VLKRAIGCLTGCAVAAAAFVIVVAVMKFVLRAGDLSGVEVGLVLLAVLVVIGIAFFGDHSHWTG
jgi:hypothetical protein